MSPMYPLAIISTASITSLVRTTLNHHVYRAKIETNEGARALGGTARNAAAENPLTQLVSDIPGGRSVENQMATESERTTLP